MTVFSETVDERGGQVIILEKRAPLAEAEIGGDERWFFLMAFLHKGEEKPNLNRFHLDVSDFINLQTIIRQILFENLTL